MEKTLFFNKKNDTKVLESFLYFTNLKVIIKFFRYLIEVNNRF